MNSLIGKQFSYDTKVWNIISRAEKFSTFYCVSGTRKEIFDEGQLLPLIDQFDKYRNRMNFRSTRNEVVVAECCITCNYQGGWRIHDMKVKCNLREEEYLIWNRCACFEKSRQFGKFYEDTLDELFDD